MYGVAGSAGGTLSGAHRPDTRREPSIRVSFQGQNERGGTEKHTISTRKTHGSRAQRLTPQRPLGLAARRRVVAARVSRHRGLGLHTSAVRSPSLVGRRVGGRDSSGGSTRAHASCVAPRAPRGGHIWSHQSSTSCHKISPTAAASPTLPLVRVESGYYTTAAAAAGSQMRLGYAFVSDHDPPSNVQVDPTSELTRSPPGHSDRGAVLGARSSRGPRAAVAPTPRHTPRSAPLDRILVAGCALRVPVTTHSLNAKARFSRCFYLRSAVQPFPSLQELLRRHLG